MNRREQSNQWWNSLPFEKQFEMIVKHKTLVIGYPDRQPGSLSGREAEMLYDAEQKIIAEEIGKLYHKLGNCPLKTFLGGWFSLSERQVPLAESVVENITKYCEDQQVYDKLANYGDFYYHLKKLMQ